MNKLLTYAAILCSAMTVSGLASCSSSDGNSDTVDMIPVQLSRDANWSMMDNKGNIFYEEQFASCPTVVINGFFSVRENEGYTLYKTKGDSAEPVDDCFGLKAVGVVVDGLVPVVRPEKRIEVVNISGDTEFELSPIDDVEVIQCDECFSNGLLGVTTSNFKHGYVNRRGKCVIPCIYDYATPFVNGYAIIGKKNKDTGEKTYYLIDTDGDEKFEIRKSSVVPEMFNGYIKIKDDDGYTLISMEGEEHKLPFQAQSLDKMKDSLIIFTEHPGHLYLANLNGEILTRGDNYYIMEFAFNGDVVAKKPNFSHNMIVLNKNGDNKMIDVDLFEAYPGFGNLCSIGNKIFLLDNEFNKINDRKLWSCDKRRSSGVLMSDAVNMEMVITGVVNLFPDDGVGVQNAKIDATAEEVMIGKDHKKYTNSMILHYKINDIIPQCKVNYSLTFSTIMARLDGWSEKSKLEKIDFGVTCHNGWKLDNHKALVNAMKQKGFRFMKEGILKTLESWGVKYYKLCALMEKDNAIAIVYWSDSGANILFVSKTTYPQIAEKISNAIFGKYVIGEDGKFDEAKAAAMDTGYIGLDEIFDSYSVF